MRFQNTHKRPSAFGFLFATDSASPKNTANSTSYHPAFLACFFFIFSATLIQTSWLGLFVSREKLQTRNPSLLQAFSGTLK